MAMSGETATITRPTIALSNLWPCIAAYGMGSSGSLRKKNGAGAGRSDHGTDPAEQRNRPRTEHLGRHGQDSHVPCDGQAQDGPIQYCNENSGEGIWNQLVKSTSRAAESHGTAARPRWREVRISASLSKSSVYPKNKTVNNVERGDIDSCGTKPTRLTP